LLTPFPFPLARESDSSDSDSDSSDDGHNNNNEDDTDSSSEDDDDDDDAINALAPGGVPNIEELLATFSKQYLHILEDGKQLSDEEEELKEVLQLRTLQQLQELSLQLIKSTQPQLVAPHSPMPMKVTRSAPVVMSAKSPSPKEKRRKRPNTGASVFSFLFLNIIIFYIIF